MKIITPKYILTPNKLIKEKAIAFENEIKAIDSLENLVKKFPDAQVEELSANSLVMPGLINPHVHLEFSANKHTLKYGSFLTWLYSVIENREELVNGCNAECMSDAITSMLKNGITTFGAVSSYGLDLGPCISAKQNVIFYNELIGSQATMADALYTDFLARLDASKSVSREGFYPAVAIHSPYSVHPILIKRALELVNNESLRVSAHFLESSQERDWLDNSSGEFKTFFEELLKQSDAVMKADEFLSLFENTPALFTHVVHASTDELQALAKSKHHVIHCPISNRLLGNGAIDLDGLEKENIDYLIGTDGLSSNYTLDLFEEMKIALFMHTDAPLLKLAQSLIESSTIKAAKALNLNKGEIAKGKDADMLILDIENVDEEQLCLHLLLHRYNINQIYINGKEVHNGRS